MRVRFTADYDHVTVEKTIAFKKGAEETVAADVGAAAIAAGKAEEMAERGDKKGGKSAD